MVEGADRTTPRWWQGRRGEWYVVAQIALFALVLFGPRHWPGLSPAGSVLAGVATAMGVLLVAGGATFVLVAILGLGRNLTPLPHPKDDGQLVEHGAYGLVRHPIYAGGVAVAFGFALIVHGILTAGYAVLLLLFFDVKSRREERWLRAKYPAYADYAKRVRKLIPFVY
jgi:protein-S-isoprenylcysteine O-methyltransferase Ste14